MKRFEYELARLQDRQPLACANEGGGSDFVQISVRTSGDAGEVLRKAKEVLSNIVGHLVATGKEFEADDLPSWFINSFAPPASDSKAQELLILWRSLSREEQIRWEENREWDLENWRYWMKPDNRQWTWWSSQVVNERSLLITILAESVPCAWGALRWLLRACGACSIEEL
jgi:hypothetical protein